MLEATYRPYRTGSVAAPLYARSVGHYSVEGDWRDPVKRKDFLQLFWGVAGDGLFTFGRAEALLRPGQVCFFLPGDVHRSVRATPTWEYYWLTVDGPELAAAIRGLGVTREPRDAGPCPADRFARLARALLDYSPRGEYRASVLAYDLLTRAVGGVGDGDDSTLAERFRRLVERRHGDPGLNVAQLARQLGTHRATLTRMAQRRFGMAPTEFLVSYRLQQALSLLCGGDLPIKEVARRTGFRDPNYFAKVVARRLGQSPSEVRRRR